jgi:hypothetical protein
MELNKIIKKVLRESIIETEVKHSIDERKTRLIQNYLDNVLVPGNKLICKAQVVRLVNQDEYLIRIWINQNEPHTQDDSDNLVDDTWDEIYNMFEVSTAIHRVNSEC